MNDEPLKSYFGFDDADLQANRRGALSEKQRKRLAKGDPSNILFGVLALGACVAPSLCLLGGTAGYHPPLAAWAVWAVWALAWAGIAAYLFIRGLSIAGIRLKKAEGPIEIVEVRSYSSTRHVTDTNYELRIGGQSYDRSSTIAAGVDPVLVNYIVEGANYVVYYVDSRAIMSFSREVMSLEQSAPGAQA